MAPIVARGAQPNIPRCVLAHEVISRNAFLVEKFGIYIPWQLRQTMHSRIARSGFLEVS